MTKLTVFIWCWLPLLLMISSGHRLHAQKVEVEERVDRETFPAAGLNYIDREFPQKKRLKFYREFSRDSLTYEAKFKAGGHWYSVEFFPDGSLLDVEKRIPFRTIPEAAQRVIRERWGQYFKRYRVVKCQEQTSSAGIRYEIEVRGKGAQKAAFYQYLFEADGTFLEREEIELRPSDMTLY